MPHHEPNRTGWQALYSAAARFFALKPWDWMLDSDVFGVRDPATGEIGYCCIMGAAEEHYALAVYQGTEGLEVLKKIGLREVPTDPFSVLVMQKCLMASFEDREMMETPDIETIHALGLKFRGRSTWPQFRSYLPGFAPWLVTNEEAAFLTIALDQACEVAERYRQRPEELGTQNAINNFERFLVRTLTDRSGKSAWTDSLETPAPYEPPLILPAPPDIDRLERLSKTGKRTADVLDVDYFYLPSAVKGDEDDRPWYPQVVLCVDDDSGDVMHFDMLKRGELGGGLSRALIDLMERIGQLPSAVQVRSGQAQVLLEPTLAALDVELKLVDSLPFIEEAQQGLLNSI